jgi:hypothetical protein
MGVSGQRHVPPAWIQGKTRHILHKSVGASQGRSGRLLKISPPLPVFDSRTTQSFASLFTDYAMPAHNENRRNWIVKWVSGYDIK